MRYAVTGGTGFIGKRLVRQLRAAGHDVVCVVRRPEAAAELSALGALLAKGDILDKGSLLAAFAGCQGVFHLAASYTLGVVGKRADAALRQNFDGTRIALEAAREAGAQKIVYTSSIVVHGNTHGAVVDEAHRPTDLSFPGAFPTHYAMSKARAHYEIVVPMIEAGAPIVIVQPGAVIGPRDHSTFRLIWTLLARGLPVPCGDAVYGMVDVEDCAAGHRLAMEAGGVGQSYHIVTENLAVAQLIDRAAAAAGIRARKLVLPGWLTAVSIAVTRLVERVIPLPDVFSADSLRCMNGVSLGVDASKLRALGFAPRPLDESLREILADERQRLSRGRAA